jgi:hypothetical protein
MISGRRLSRLLVAASVLAVSSCDPGSPTPPADPPVDGSVAGSVEVEGAGLPGIQVSLSGPVARTVATDGGGRFRFDGLGEGSYVVAVVGLPGEAEFPTSTGSVAITRDRPTALVDFPGTWKRDVSIAVTVRVEGGGFEAASVSLQGPGATSGVTDTAGTVLFEGLRRGTWQVALGGYDPALYDFPATTATVEANGPPLTEVTFEGTEIPQPPAAPAALVAIAGGADAIGLTWNDLSDDEERFDIERRAPGGSWSRVHSVGDGVTTFADAGLDPAATWAYRVRACNAAGCSDPSNEVEATTADVPPAAPTDLAAASTGPSRARITWTDASGNETHFDLERRPAAASGGAGAATAPWTSTASPGADETVFDDTGLSPATTYEYRIRACNDVGCSSFTAAASATTDDVPPSAPTNPSVVVTGATTLRVTWVDTSGNEDAFEVERREGAAGPWSAIGSAAAGATRLDDTGLLVTTEYGYRVRACNAAGCSDWTSEATGTTADVPPLAPSTLVAVADGESAIDLSWVDESGNETGFQLESGPNGSTWSLLASPSADATTFSHSGLAAGTTRHYRVRACNADGCSDWSATVSATTDQSPPDAPGALVASADGETSIDLNWSDDSDDETSFELQRSPDGSSWGALTTRPAGVESWTDTGLSGGETWYYRVRACNAAGCSAWSNQASATTDTPPPGGPNLSIGGVYINQRIQRLAGDVPLVADMDGYLRVFVLASEANSFTPDVRADFYLGGGLAHTETLSAPGGAVPETVDEGSLSSSWNVLVPGWLIQDGLEIEVVVDPANDVSESDESDNSWPGGGTPASLDVRDTPTFDVTFVPVRQTVNGTVGDVSAGNAANFLDEALDMLPFSDADVEIRAEYSTDSPAVESGTSSTWSTVLSELSTLRSLDGSARFYYGVLEVTYGGGIAGIGYVGWPIALGWDKSGSAGGVAAHEWGHNLGRPHSPGCGAGGADGSYPHAGGKIGHWGLDVPSLTLKSPDTFHDFMTYCGPDWISDYVFEKIIDRVAPATYLGAPARLPGRMAAATPAEPGLLVWGRIEGGEVVLEPVLEVDAPASVPEGGAYTIQGRDAGGATLFSYAFDPIPVADGDGDEGHFTFVIPTRSFDRAALAEIQLSSAALPTRVVRSASVGPARAPGVAPAVVTRVDASTAEVSWNPLEYPMVVVRDADTGEVLSLGRSGRVRVTPGADRVELEFSNGLGTTERLVSVWR